MERFSQLIAVVVTDFQPTAESTFLETENSALDSSYIPEKGTTEESFHDDD